MQFLHHLIVACHFVLTAAHKPYNVDYKKHNTFGKAVKFDEPITEQSVGVYPIEYNAPGTKVWIDMGKMCTTQTYVEFSVFASANTAINCKNKRDCWNNFQYDKLVKPELIFPYKTSAGDLTSAGRLAHIMHDKNYKGFHNSKDETHPDKRQIAFNDCTSPTFKNDCPEDYGFLSVPKVKSGLPSKGAPETIHAEQFGAGVYVPINALSFQCDPAVKYHLRVEYLQSESDDADYVARESHMITMGIGSEENFNLWDFLFVLPFDLPLQLTLDHLCTKSVKTEPFHSCDYMSKEASEGHAAVVAMLQCVLLLFICCTPFVALQTFNVRKIGLRDNVDKSELWAAGYVGLFGFISFLVAYGYTDSVLYQTFITMPKHLARATDHTSTHGIDWDDESKVTEAWWIHAHMPLVFWIILIFSWTLHIFAYESQAAWYTGWKKISFILFGVNYLLFSFGLLLSRTLFGLVNLFYAILMVLYSCWLLCRFSFGSVGWTPQFRRLPQGDDVVESTVHSFGHSFVVSSSS